MSNKDVIYFSWITALEENFYLDASDAFLKEWFNYCTESKIAQEIVEQYRHWGAVDLIGKAKCQPQLDGYDCRVFQTGIYLLVAHYVEEVLQANVTSLCFYSSGAYAAYVFAGVLTTAQYLNTVSPFFGTSLRLEMAEWERSGKLVEILLRGGSHEDTAELAQRVIAHRHLEDRVFIKDRRDKSTTLLAGFAADARSVVADMYRVSPTLNNSKEPRFEVASAAHLPLLSKDRLRRLLDSTSFAPPRIAIVGAQGQVVPAGCRDTTLLRHVLEEGCMGLMDTGQATQSLSPVDGTVHFVGSRRAAKALDRLFLPERVRVVTATGST